MVPNHASASFSESEIEVKAERVPEPKLSNHHLLSSRPALVSSPLLTSVPAQACTPTSPVSSPPVSLPLAIASQISEPKTLCSTAATTILPGSAEVPTRKRPIVRAKIEEATCIECQQLNAFDGNNVLEPTVGTHQSLQSTGSDKDQVKAEVNTTGSIGSTLGNNGFLHYSVATSVSLTPVVAIDVMHSAENNSFIMGDKKSSNIDRHCISSLGEVPSSTSTTESKTVVADASSPYSKPMHQEIEVNCKLPGNNLLTESEGEQSLLNTPASVTAHLGKYEIDLMAPPKVSPSVASEKTHNSLDSVAPECNEKMQGLATFPIKVERPDKESNKDEMDDAESNIGNSNVRQEGKPGMEHMEIVVHARHEGREAQHESVNGVAREKGNKEISNQASLQTGKNVKSYAKTHQNPDRSVSSCTMAIPSLHPASILTGSPFPASMRISGWLPPGSLPHPGYYYPAAMACAAAAAAGWPATASINGAAAMDENSPSALPVQGFGYSGAQQPLKRCATHVYIAYFIDAQQQFQRHPLWAAVYANAAASFCHTKVYNLNMSLPPDSIFGGGTSWLKGLSGSLSAGFVGKRSAPLQESHNDKGLRISSSQSSKEKGSPSCQYASARNVSARQPTQACQQLQDLPLQIGPGLHLDILSLKHLQRAPVYLLRLQEMLEQQEGVVM